MADPTKSPADEPERHWFTAWVHARPRQAIVLGFVFSLLIFAIIRGFLSDEVALVQRTEVAKERWALIVASQENFYESNGHYSDDPDVLEDVRNALATPTEDLFLHMELKDADMTVTMTLTGNTVRLRQTLASGEPIDTSCQILQARAGDC